MASIKYDSELMTTYVSAAVVPPGSKFVNCLDVDSRRPMVFSLSNDEVPKLYLIKEDESGTRVLVNFSSLLGLDAKTPVQAFDAQQGPDLTIYMVYATPNGTDKSSVTALKPFKVTRDFKVEKLPATTINNIQNFYLGPVGKNASDFPMVLAVHDVIYRKGKDISRIAVDLSKPASSPAVLRDLEMPVNAGNILSIAVGSSMHGNGIYVLYEISGIVKLLSEFVQADASGSLTYWVGEVMCPPKATRVASVTDLNSNYTGLVVSYDQGLQYLTPNETIVKDAPGRNITGHALFKSCKSLYAVQDDSQVGLWAINKNDQLGYYRTTTNNMGGGLASTLLDAGRAKSFAASIKAPFNDHGSAWQFLVAADKDSNLKLLRQCVDTGIWHSEPFWVADTSKNISLECYSIHVQPTGPDGLPVLSGKVQVRASSEVDAIVNGSTVSLSQSATLLDLDSDGEIAFLVPTSGMTCQNLTLSDVVDVDGKAVGASAVTIDPSVKIIQAFSKITTGAQLKDAQTQSGKPLFQSGTVPAQIDLDSAAKCFQDMTKALADVRKSRSKKQMISAQTKAVSDAMRAPIELFHYLKQVAKDVTDFVTKKVGEVWEFTCKIAGAFRTFVLDTVEKIGEGLSWVWNKIKLGFQKLIDLAGWIFNWDDIKRTKNMIQGFMLASLDFTMQQAAGAASKVDAYFDAIEKKLLNNGRSMVPQPPTITFDSKQAKSQSQSDSVTSSSKFKWTGERIKNGGVRGGATLKGPGTPATSDDPWSKYITPALKQVEPAIQKLSQDITDIFKKDRKISASELFTRLGQDILKLLLDAIRALAKAMISMMASLATSLKTIGTTPINIPIFSWLFKKFGGEDLTVFSGIALLVAIPATVIYKACTKRDHPPDVGPITADDFAQAIGWNTAPAPNTSKRTLATPPQVNLSTKAVIVDQAAENSLDLYEKGEIMTHESHLKALKAGPIWTTIQADVRAAMVAAADGAGLLVALYDDYEIIQAARSGGTKGVVKSPLKLGGKTGPAIGLGFRLLGSISAIMNTETKPAADQRRTMGAVSFAHVIISALILSLPAERNHIEMQSLLDLCVGVYALISNIVIYDAEINAKPSEWKDYNKEISDLRFSEAVFSFVNDVSKFVAIQTARKKNVQATVVAVVVKNVAATTKGALGIGRYVKMYQKGMVPEYVW